MSKFRDNKMISKNYIYQINTMMTNQEADYDDEWGIDDSAIEIIDSLATDGGSFITSSIELKMECKELYLFVSYKNYSDSNLSESIHKKIQEINDKLIFEEVKNLTINIIMLVNTMKHKVEIQQDFRADLKKNCV
ncbi:MAG: hypothetical protein CVV00_02950 [Firmicutes bacterium HGW-Firmicutes-5]|nr:MAG: hypothetical protein CVV00_02950 [Firmicutes bacterium HGW-Firmicutes-5]